MINLSNYHSNGLPTAVWSNKVNLIGEKVYKPKLHFCEHCNKPILIYGRLIPCKHVFCFTCATLCLTSQQSNRSNSSARSPPQPHNGVSNHIHNQSVASPHEPPLPPPPNQHHPYHQSPLAYNNNNNNNSTHGNDRHHHNHQQRRRTPTRTSNNHVGGGGARGLDLHRTDSNHSLSSRDNHNDRYHSQQQHSNISNIDESTNNTTPTTIQQDMSIDSPSFNGTEGSPTVNKASGASKGCHRCGGKALRVERNTLNSIFVCQIETCCRTYLSARDLQAHVNHRHARSKSSKSNPSASIAAISSSPYISSSTLQHLNNQHSSSSAPHDHNDHPEPHQHNNSRRHGKSSQQANNNHHHPPPAYHATSRHAEREGTSSRGHPRDTGRGERFRERDNYQRDRERERDSKEYHRQSLQRAAQWAEQSAQIMEKGLTR